MLLDWHWDEAVIVTGFSIVKMQLFLLCLRKKVGFGFGFLSFFFLMKERGFLKHGGF